MSPSKHTSSLKDTDYQPEGKLSKSQIHIMLQWELSSNLAPSFRGHVTLGEQFHLPVPLFPFLLNWGNKVSSWLGYYLE